MKPYGSLNLPPTVRLTEVEFLMDSGEDVYAIAARLGVKAATIEKTLHRSGRTDLVAKISRGRGV